MTTSSSERLLTKPAPPALPTAPAGTHPPDRHRRNRLARWASPRAILTAVLALILACLVVPPVVIMVLKSFVGGLSLSGVWGFDAYKAIAATDLWAAFRDTFVFAVGAMVLTVALGSILAWIVARTDAPLRKLGIATAFVGLSIPGLVNIIGWTLLFGNGRGQGDQALSSFFGTNIAISVQNMPGMIIIESLLSMPLVFFLMLGPMQNFNASLEEAGEIFGANRWQLLRRVTMPLLLPSLLSGALLILIRAIQSFEVPILIGVPAGAHIFTTELYTVLHSGLIPNYSAAAAYGTILLVVLLLLVGVENRITRDTRKFAVVTGKSNVRGPRHLRGPVRYLPGVFIVLLLLGYLVPVIYLIYTSFEPNLNGFSSFGELTLANYTALFNESSFGKAVANTLIVAASTAIVVLLLSSLSAWVAARSARTGARFVTFFANAPLVIPGVVLGFSFLLLYLYAPVHLVGSLLGIIIAFVALYMPYGMRTMRPAIIGVSTELEESARVFGASEGSVLRRVLLPLVAPSAVGSAQYVFFHSFRELAVAALLITAATPLLSTMLLDSLVNGNLNIVSALGTFITLFTVIIGGGLSLVLALLRRRKNASRVR